MLKPSRTYQCMRILLVASSILGLLTTNIGRAASYQWPTSNPPTVCAGLPTGYAQTYCTALFQSASAQATTYAGVVNNGSPPSYSGSPNSSVSISGPVTVNGSVSVSGLGGGGGGGTSGVVNKRPQQPPYIPPMSAPPSSYNPYK